MPMRQTHRGRLARLLAFASVFSVGLVAFDAYAQPRPGQPISVASPAVLRARQLEGGDNDTLLAVIREGGQVRSIVDPARFDSVQIEMFNGTKVSLRTVVTEITSEMDRFGTAATRARAALAGAPEIVDAVVETNDAFVVSKSVHVVVSDPAAFARESQEFRDYLQNRPAAAPRYAGLDAEARAAFDQYVRTEVPNLAASHPLARAAAQGSDALLRAVYDGLGDFEITDTISFAKEPLAQRNGQLLHPTFRNGLFDPGAAQALPESVLSANALRVLPDISVPEVNLPDPPPSAATTTGGQHAFETEFLAGFTVGRRWDWERRWNFGVGFFRLSLGASYGYGLRLPMRVRVNASPTRVVTEGDFDRAHEVRADVRMESFDGDEAFYRRVGLPRDRVFSGKELVLEASFYYGLKLNAFGRDWIHIRRRDSGFNRSADFAPPLGNRRATATLEIPPEVTNTRFGSRYLGGYAQFGVAAELEGNASIEARWSGTRAQRPFERLTFSNAQPQSIEGTLPVLEAAEGRSVTRNYGLHFRNPRYEISASLVPMIRGVAEIDVGVYANTFSTGWLRLNAFRVPLASETFGAHAGTAREHYEEIGFKTFEHTARSAGAAANAAAADQALSGNVALRLRGGNFVRAGIGGESQAGASSAQVGAWERFAIVAGPASGNQQIIGLRSLQNQRLLRVTAAPALRLGATSNTLGQAEQFTVHRVNGGIALQNRQNGRFVVAEQDDARMLAATAERIERAAVFEVVPQR